MEITIQQYAKLRPTITIERKNYEKLHYATPNELTAWRAQTLFSKEPATIAWLDRIKENEVMLDVGANVGMYSIYAAKWRRAKVFSFEPESQNFALLAKNIILNNLENKIVPFCAALSDKISINTLYLSGFAWDGGSSCHSFGEEVGFDLNPRKSPFMQGCLSYSIDEAVASGAIEMPSFIKVDVDGFEHLVLHGARKTLQDHRLRSICIEINPSIKEHQELIFYLNSLGFYHDPIQVEKVTRKEGDFKGCAEYIFDRLTTSLIIGKNNLLDDPDNNIKNLPEARETLNHILKKISAAEITTDPFPYTVIDNIFPDEYFKKILDLFPTENQLVSLSETGRVSAGSYDQRLVTLFNKEHFSKLDEERKKFYTELSSWLYSSEFIGTVVQKFLPWCANRLAQIHEKKGRLEIHGDALLVSDRTRYEIGPHTDAPHRLISFLFYLPKNEKDRKLGTSIYTSKDPGFVCPGGPHYNFADFNKINTIEFIPNRLLMFVRTARSFHGVEPILEEKTDRRLLISNVRLVD
jgi:FkbM family methyltransferase